MGWGTTGGEVMIVVGSTIVISLFRAAFHVPRALESLVAFRQCLLP